MVPAPADPAVEVAEEEGDTSEGEQGAMGSARSVFSAEMFLEVWTTHRLVGVLLCIGIACCRNFVESEHLTFSFKLDPKQRRLYPGAEVIASIGSYGHPEVCRRRCVHFLRQGEHCQYSIFL